MEGVRIADPGRGGDVDVRVGVRGFDVPERIAEARERCRVGSGAKGSVGQDDRVRGRPRTLM
ncbi:hypothetical protein SHO565_73780 [Streptomyces sp. HO565]